MMFFRGDQCVRNATFVSVFGACLISTSTLVASAAETQTAVAATEDAEARDSAATRTLPSGLMISSTGAVMMAPIPDKGSAQRAAAVAAAGAEPRGSFADTISLTERPAMIIRDGVITMASVGERASASDSDDDDDEDSNDNAARPRGKAARSRNEKACLAQAVYFEARGESARGQAAVAQVVLARVKARGRPKSICGVVYEGSHLSTGCQFSFTCDGVADVIRDRGAWARAQGIASRAMRGKLKSVARGATYFHARYVRPYWASSMVKVATIGTHVFYRP
jgi:hypothetical protein